MKKIFFFIKIFFASTLILSFSSCEEMINAMLNSDSPTVTMSQGTHPTSITISWTAPSKEHIIIEGYQVSYGKNDVAESGSINVGFTTSYTIPYADNAQYYSAKVRVIYRDEMTNVSGITGNWSSTAQGFAMDSTKLTWTSAATVWQLKSTETWFTTMMQKGYRYTFSNLFNVTKIELFKEGTLDRIKDLDIIGNTSSWLCDETGNSGKFYIKVYSTAGSSMTVTFSE